MLVRWPDGTRRGRIAITAEHRRALRTGTALPSQARELATGTAKGDGPLPGPEGSRPVFVEDVECRQALFEDLLFMEDQFAILGGAARHRIRRRRRACYRCSAASDNDNPAAPNTGKVFLARFVREASFARDM